MRAQYHEVARLMYAIMKTVVLRLRHFGVLLIVLIALFPGSVFSAGVSFSPSSGNHAIQEEFSVRVTIAPSGASVNAADGVISFDPAILSVSSVSREGSVFSLWTSDPTFSNSAGTVTFSGGTPTPFSNSGTALTIKFKGKAQGTGTVSVKQASVLAADGKGTNVYEAGAGASFTISGAKPKPTPPPVEPDPAPSENSGGASELVPPPDITSSTHKKADAWYATTTAIVSWKIPVGMVSIRTGISGNKDDKPKTVHTPIIATETFQNLTEGIWYVTAQFKDDFEWGTVAVREIRVDVTPPDEFELALLEGGEGSTPKLVFGTDDALSGVSRYEIHINGAIAASLKPEELIENAYPVPPQEGGPATVLIKAFDGAGNVREVTKQMELPVVVKVDPKAAEEEGQDSGFRYEWIIISLLTFGIGGLVAWHLRSKRAIEEEQMLVLKRVIEIRERNDKIFSAMREEFEQLISDFDERPQLTPEERSLLEKIKEVLDISEEVVDSDIEELKKLVKRS